MTPEKDSTNKQKNYVNSQRIAELLSLTDRAIRKMAANNKIPAIKIGGVWRFDEAKTLKYIEKKYSNDYHDV